MNLFAAFSIGILGSFHCIGMCGPLALALPLPAGSAARKAFAALLYNLGRILSYGWIGLMTGLLGQGFAIAGYQQQLSIITGVLILLYVLIPARLKAKFPVLPFTAALGRGIKQKLSALYRKPGNTSSFLIGVLNGFLPCGLVYMALAGALVSGQYVQGSLFMIFFGLGTLPAMFGMAMAGSWISLETRNRMRRAVPVFIGLMALMLILRGLNLGIPYVSPKTQQANDGHSAAAMECCHKPQTP